MTALDDNLALADSWAPTFKLLGDPTRLKLLAAIHFGGQYSYTVTELAEITGVKLATASAALRSMHQSGTVRSEREGRQIRYGLHDDRVHQLLHYIGSGHSYKH